MRRTVLIAGAIALLSAPAPAQAYMTLRPDRAPGTGITRLDLEVVNDRDYTSITSIRLRGPPGIDVTAPALAPGWRVRVARGGRPRVTTVAWTGNAIGPEQFEDFGLLVPLYGKPGTLVRFGGVVGFSDGEADRWEGTPADGAPYPVVTLTRAPDAVPAAARPARAHVEQAATVAADDGGDAPTWLALLALAIGVLGLLVGVVGLTAGRRHRSRA